MSLTINLSSSNKALAPPSSKQDSCELYQKVAKYILDHYYLFKAPQFENMSLAEILKQKPVILLGESHDNQNHRKYHGWIINHLYHDQAILLTESKHKSQTLQTKFVDLHIIKKSKSWDLENPSINPAYLHCEHLYIHLNATQRVMRIMKGEISSNPEFDEWLDDYIQRNPNQPKYKKLKTLLDSSWNKEEKFQQFLKLMIELINETEDHMHEAIKESLKERDPFFFQNLKFELDRGLQPIAIAGQAHVSRYQHVVKECLLRQIPFISCMPKTKLSKKGLIQGLAKVSKTDDTLIDLEQNILKAKNDTFRATGPMSMYKINPILAEYCKLKLAELEKSSSLRKNIGTLPKPENLDTQKPTPITHPIPHLKDVEALLKPKNFDIQKAIQIARSIPNEINKSIALEKIVYALLKPENLDIQKAMQIANSIPDKISKSEALKAIDKASRKKENSD